MISGGTDVPPADRYELNRYNRHDRRTGNLLRRTEDLSAGVGIIDDQHKELFKRINTLLSAMSHGKGEERVAGVSGFFSDYVVTHFSTEERYMVAYGYPGLQAHKGEHDSYVEKLSDFR